MPKKVRPKCELAEIFIIWLHPDNHFAKFGGGIMPIIIEGSALPAGSAISYNGVDLKKIYCNDILVWQKYIASQGTLSSYSGYNSMGGTGTPLVFAASSPGDPGGQTHSRTSMTGNVLAWNGSKGAIITALCDCRVTISGTLKCSRLEGSVTYKLYYYKGNSQLSNFAYAYLSNSTGTSKSHTLSYAVELKKGDTLSVRVLNMSSGDRLGVSGNVTFSGVAA